MPRHKIDPAELKKAVARLPEYPAVLTPGVGGGCEVVFPNFAKLTAYGVGRDMAMKAARDLLSAHLQGLLEEGDQPPRPSDPARLIPDEDEPPGTELVMIAPDRGAILRRLGLKRQDRGLALASLGRLGR
ncbi:MAG: type II toxin-antitoxin system HicB family antitoxin [Desulfarculus sp.]|nr:type II toxin-antitoxin system HicB family antitoxin [Desulfarculus sp.]